MLVQVTGTKCMLVQVTGTKWRTCRHSLVILSSPQSLYGKTQGNGGKTGRLTVEEITPEKTPEATLEMGGEKPWEGLRQR